MSYIRLIHPHKKAGAVTMCTPEKAAEFIGQQLGELVSDDVYQEHQMNRQPKKTSDARDMFAEIFGEIPPENWTDEKVYQEIDRREKENFDRMIEEKIEEKISTKKNKKGV